MCIEYTLITFGNKGILFLKGEPLKSDPFWTRIFTGSDFEFLRNPEPEFQLSQGSLWEKRAFGKLISRAGIALGREADSQGGRESTGNGRGEREKGGWESECQGGLWEKKAFDKLISRAGG